MRQIISGETHKTKVLSKKVVDDFLESNIKLFKESLNLNFLYENQKTIDDPVLNYLNSKSDLIYLKDILRKEFDDCEKIYPYLGDVFINHFFENMNKRLGKKFRFNKRIEKNFLETFKNKEIKSIADIIFKNASLEYMINIEKYSGEQIVVEKKSDLNIDVQFDFSYFSDFGIKKIKNYNCLIIDGIIDSVGEIHHLLHKASIDKEDYLIFCVGINDEVKKTIMTNNKKRITKVWPINIEFSEKTLNLLNDIAVIHESDVITATKGQTISQEVRKKLKKGNEIVIKNGVLTVVPTCSKSNLQAHKNFILKRIEEAPHTESKKLLKKRYKNLSSKSINVYLPKILCQHNFIRELDYLLRFMSNLNKVFTIVKLDNKNYYVPISYVKIAYEKSKNTKKIIENIEKIIAINN